MACGPALQDLPQALLLHIFSYLSPRDIVLGVRPTCRYFRCLSLFVDLWTHFSILRWHSCHIRGKDKKFLRKPFRYFYNLLRQECILEDYKETEGRSQGRQRSERGEGFATVKNVVTAVKEEGHVWPSLSVTGKMWYPNLKQVALIHYRLPPMAFLAHYPALVSLRLELRYLGRAADNFVSFFDGLAALKNLQTLELVNTGSFDSCLVPANRAQALGVVRVRNSMKRYFSTGPGLRRIELCCFVYGDMLTIMLKQCLQLKDLTLSKPYLKSSAFTLVPQEPKLLLSSLRVQGYKNFTTNSLSAIARSFPNLNCLEVTLTESVTVEQVFSILGAFFRHLTSLELTVSPRDVPPNDDPGMGIGPQCFGDFADFGNLHHLVLNNVWPCRPLLCESLFEKVCQHHSKLTTVQLLYWKINNSHITILADNCSLLKTVKIEGSHNVDSEGVAYLMKKLARLQTCAWIVRESRGVPAFNIKKILPGRQRGRSGRGVWLDKGPAAGSLQSLELDPCSSSSLTAKRVSGLALFCPHLRHLTLRAARGLNDAIVRAILRAFPQLQHLELGLKKRRGKPLTSKSLQHIHTWGTCLKRLKLLMPRSFNTKALLQLLSLSSTIDTCEVNALRADQVYEPNMPHIRVVTRILDQMTGFKEKVHVSLSELRRGRLGSVPSMPVLVFHILRE